MAFTKVLMPEERFRPKYVVAPNGCWEWIAASNSNGFYGITYEEAVALRRGDASSSSKLDNVRVGADAGQTNNDWSAA